MWSSILTVGCAGTKTRTKVILPPAPKCDRAPRVRDYCAGEIDTGEDCMVCTNARACVDPRRSVYCVDGDICDDQRCQNGESPTQRGNGLLISE